MCVKGYFDILKTFLVIAESLWDSFLRERPGSSSEISRDFTKSTIMTPLFYDMFEVRMLDQLFGDKLGCSEFGCLFQRLGQSPRYH